MNIVFLGSFYPKEREIEIRQNCLRNGIDNAANNLQWAMLDGLDFFYPNLKVITQPAIGTFPQKYKRIFFKSSFFSHKSGAKDYCLSIINIPLLKHLIQKIYLTKALCKKVKSHEKTFIIIYGIYSPFLKAAVDLKKTNANIKLCLIVPDLPQFMSESKNPIYLFFKRIDSILINKYLKQIDSFVLLSDFMAKALKIGNCPWIRIEGIFNSDKALHIPTKENNQTILYTGNIGERYGIKTLLKAFNLIKNENYRLWIRGNGNTKEEVINAAKSDFRIRYFEEMPRNELLALQKKATVLINPVPTIQRFSKYFFPSKIMDYMASGTPTITTRLESIPNEYFDYLYFAEREDAQGLKDTILFVCEKDQKELDEFGGKASKFIIENKNSRSQVKKIYDMIASITCKS